MLSMDLIQLPKIDLHCHLDGSLSQECIRTLLNRDVNLQELQVGNECKNLAQYLEKFDLPLQCLQTEEGLKKAGFDFIQEVAKDNISYIEVRFAPLLSTNKKLSCEQVVEAVLSGLEAGKKIYNVDYNVIVCAMRHHSYDENRKMIETIRRFIGKGVCAVDLAGDEAAFPMKNYESLFGEVNEWGIPFTIHAGECGSVTNVIDAIHLGAQRIGHGIALRGQEDAMQLCREKNIGIEMCPISNLQTKAVKYLAEYPMREFINHGLCVTINTDNRTVSNTTIMREIEFVQTHWNITDTEIIQMMRNAVEVAFANEEVKERLRKLI